MAVRMLCDQLPPLRLRFRPSHQYLLNKHSLFLVRSNKKGISDLTRLFYLLQSIRITISKNEEIFGTKN